MKIISLITWSGIFCISVLYLLKSQTYRNSLSAVVFNTEYVPNVYVVGQTSSTLQ